MKKIVITNAYTWYNKGDAGILLGVIEALKQVYNNDIKVNILSFTPNEDKKRYCKDNKIEDVYSNILNPFPYKHTKIGKMIAIIKLFIKMIYIYILTKISMDNAVKKNKTLKVLSESDLIVVCGGGFLGGKKYDSLIHVFQIYINTLFHKPVIVMGTSIEPMKKGIIKKYTEKVLKKVDYIYARENITYEYLNTFLDKSKYETIPDLAFMIEDVKEDKLLANEKKFGITVRKWNFPNSNNKKEAMENYIKSVTDMIDYIYNTYKIKFVFVPQVIVENGNDADIAKIIKQRLNTKEALQIVEEDLSPVQIKTLISSFEIFVGTRMHSNIFATSMNVPTVAIAYEKKTNGIMEMLNLSDYVINIEEINSENLINKVEMAIKNKESIKENLKIKIKQIRKEILEKLSTIKQF